jgi:arginyl-tRNA synthetase
MSLIQLQNTLRERVRAAALEKFNVQLERISAEVPPRIELGDLAFPVAFELARRVKEATGEKRNPRAIAEEMRAALAGVEGVARVDIAGAGYLNVFYDRAAFLARLAAESANASDTAPARAEGAKLIVEHTNINPNKAAHIGHLRNAVLGDTVVRILRATGHRVEVQNYIDNTGVQVADVVVGFIHLERMTLDDVKALDQKLDVKFDYYCWDLYARVGLFYRNGDPEAKEDPERLKLRGEVLHAIEAGDNPTSELADYVATRIVQCHLDTMERLGIRYDLLPRESEILRLRFWDRAFQRLKETGAIRFETAGRNAGCWVMPTDAHTGTDEHEADKIIVRSNGTVTYAGKDIAYQLWKLGLLGLDFHYKPFRAYPDGHTVWVTTADASEDTSERPHFGGGQVVYNVIDSRQSYTQDVVRRGVAAVAPEAGDAASVHLAYEMVALSPAACEELGIELSAEDRARPYVEMSGRKGLGVKADDLLDRLEAGARREVEARHADLSDEKRRQVAHEIAVGALRYFLLKFTRNTVIAFDFKEALSFEGETGPYCQYAAVRTHSIFRKLGPAARSAALGLIADPASESRARIARVLDGEKGDELWEAITLAARVDEATAQAAAATEPAILAKYAFQLARTFSNFYQRKENRIIDEPDEARRAVLIAIADASLRALERALATLGIRVPERM